MKDSPAFWTLSQRRALIALLAASAMFIAFLAYLRPVALLDLPAVGPRSGELADKIDPNTATAAELANIPELGRVRAAAIVAYREAYLAAHPGATAFSSPDDLRNVKGIGPATLEKLKPHLDFDSAGSEEK